LGYGLLFVAIPLHLIFPPANVGFILFIFLFAVIQIFRYLGWFDFLFPKKKSHNVYTIIDPNEGKIERTLLFSAHIDSSWNWNLALKNPLKMWIKIPYGIVGGGVLLLLSFLNSLDMYNVVHLWTPWLDLLIIPFIPGFIFLIRFLSWNPKIASPGAMDNLTGVSTVLLLLKYMKEHPEEIPTNCRLIFAVFGSEESGDKGSLAFIHQHKQDLLQNAWVFNIDSVSDYDSFIVISGDGWLGAKYDPNLVRMAIESMKELEVQPAKAIVNPVGGTDAAFFVKNHIPAVTLTAQNPIASEYYHTKNDKIGRLNPLSLEKMNQILLNLIKKWDNFTNKVHSQF
jgi:hypothetical protein